MVTCPSCQTQKVSLSMRRYLHFNDLTPCDQQNSVVSYKKRTREASMMEFLTEYRGLICFGIGIMVGGAGGVVAMAIFSCTDDPWEEK